MDFSKASLFLISLCLLGSGCTVFDEIKARQVRAREERVHAALRAEARARHAEFRTQSGWKSRIYRNEELLKQATPENVSLEISLSGQRGFLLVHGAIAMDFPVATGRKSHPTPAGEYKIRAKEKNHSSNLYGKIVDATGAVVVSDADTRSDAVPEGASFVGASMPYWMRLTDTGVGLHVGHVPGGRAASHGCIRLKRSVAVELFKLVKIGTPVIIAETAPALAADQPAKRR